jgi:Lysyl oxidase
MDFNTPHRLPASPGRFRWLMAAWLLLIGALLAPASHAARDSLENRYDIAVYPNGGKPDLTVDPIRLKSQLNVIDRYFDPNNPSDQCAYQEGTIGGFGWRRLMIFDVVIVNAGDGDLVVGDRADPNNPYAGAFYFDPCHGHYHMAAFSEYRLLYQSDGNAAQVGRKQGFCFQDDFKFSDNPSKGYNCAYQGITSGWGDWYYKQLPGQWIDVTGVPEGNYILEVQINLQGKRYEFDQGANKYPDITRVPASVPKRRER